MKSSIEKIIVTVSIDTECDHDVNWVRANPLTYKSILVGVPDRLQPAFDEVGAVPTYLLTVEVMEQPDCVSALKNLSGHYELGTHLHAAFIEPEKKYFDYAGVDSPDFQCSYAPDVEYQKLQNLSELFKRSFGYTPTSFRAGRYGANHHSLNSLQKLGYKVDTSVTPHIRWTEPNAVVDFRKAPEQPYFPSSSSASVPESYTDGRILEVPVTIKPRLIRRSPKWFRPWFSSVDEMKEIFHYHMKKYRDNRILSINMMFHSMEIIEKASPYPQTASDVARFLEDMQEGLNWCKEEGAVFGGLSSLHSEFVPG
ncbi:MAG: hypothetical protein KTR35_22780 [Gammaproteobacteria bacterium]|nr:hypothetical protein [Gammaproteobacteria bacterium]